MVTHEPSRRATLTAILLFAVTLVLALGFPYFEATRNANERPRLIQGMTLVEHGEFAIDGRARRGLDPGPDVSRSDDGHLYPNKPPTTSMAAAVGYVWARGAARVRGAELTLRDYTYWSRFFGGVLPTVLLVLMAIRNHTPRDGLWPAAAAATVYLIATPAQVYGHLLYGHQLAALALYVGIDLLAEAHEHGSFEQALGGGLAAGFAVAVEYGAVFAGLPVAVMLSIGALRKPSGPRVLSWSVAGALVPIAGLAAYQWRAYGSPLKTGYHFAVNPEFAEKHAQGLLGLSWPTWEGFSRHMLSVDGGLLWWAPVVLVAVWGLVDLARDEQAPHRTVGALSLGVLGTMVLVGAGLVFDGGWRVGPRYLVCALPMIIPGLARVFSGQAGRPWVIGLVAIPVGWGVAVNGLAANLWPHLDLTNVHAPVAEVLLPLLYGGHAPYGPLRHFPYATWILVGLGVVTTGWTLFEVARLERRTAGLWGPLGLAVGVLAVPVLAGTVEPHPRGPDNLTYVERTFEPRLDGTDGPTRVLEQLDTLPEPKRRRGNAGRL